MKTATVQGTGTALNKTGRAMADSGVYEGFYALCLALAIFLNLFIVAIIVYLFLAESKRKARMRSPSIHVAILTCCIVLLLSAVYPYSLAFHIERVQQPGVPTPCFALLAASVGFCVLDTLTLLVIAVVTFAETMRRGFLVVADRKAQVKCTVALLVASITYACFLVVPIFFMVWLGADHGPCVYTGGDTKLDVSTHPSARRALPAVKYLIPFLLLMLAQFLLKLTECVRPKYSLVHSNTNSSAKRSGLIEVTGTGPSGTEDDSGPTTALIESSGQSRNKTIEPNGNTGNENRDHRKHTSGTRHTRPRAQMMRVEMFSVALNIRLAGLFASAMYFLEFFLMFAYWDVVEDPNPAQQARFQAASEFLKVLVLVAVPCCWLGDTDVRRALPRLSKCSRKL